LVGLAKLATHPDLRRDDALEFAQLALRRCTYLLLEMYAIERRAPEACALVARSVVETALIGSYLAVTPDASSRLVKKQAKHSRRLRDRLLAGDNDAVLALLADAEFIAAPLVDELDAIKAAPDLAQISRLLDNHPPFDETKLACHLYDEVYSFLSNYVEHPTPLSLERHRGRRFVGRGVRPFPPSGRVSPATLAHTASPAVAALAGCLARRVGEDASDFDEWARDAMFADGYAWSGSPLRMAAVASTVRSVGLSRPRADAVGFLLRTLAIGDGMRDATSAEQLAVAFEAMDLGQSWRPLLLTMWGNDHRHRLSRGRWRDVSAEELAIKTDTAVAALFLAYAGVWPVEEAALGSTLASACRDVHAVEPDVLDRVWKTELPDFGMAMRRVRQRVLDFE
jgi:hypothetical protein